MASILTMCQPDSRASKYSERELPHWDLVLGAAEKERPEEATILESQASGRLRPQLAGGGQGDPSLTLTPSRVIVRALHPHEEPP